MNSVEQRKIISKFVVVIVAVLLISLCYSYFLPRTEVEIDTVYHSSYSGLFVQSKISNSGTKEITDLKVKLGVWNPVELSVTLDTLKLLFTDRDVLASYLTNAFAALCLVSVAADVPSFAEIVSTFNTLVIRCSNIH